MAGSKKMAKLVLNWKTMRWLVLCAVLSVMSSPALALMCLKPIPSVNTVASQQTVREVTVTVRSTGCEPAGATQTPGQINLKVLNQTGGADLLVQLYDGHGNLLREAVIQQGSTQWSETFDLKAGNYTLVAGRNQAWAFHLTVQ